MNTGMLWFDNSSKTDLKTKVIQAATYYRDKYGAVPNRCFVHPSMLSAKQKDMKVGRVEIKADGTVLPHHLFMGVGGK
jgi:hypothetical protein